MSRKGAARDPSISLDALLAEGLADIEAGRVIDADTVFEELLARYAP